MGTDKQCVGVDDANSLARLALAYWESSPWLAWHRSVIAQQQWLIEWYLGLAVGALNPIRSGKLLLTRSPPAKTAMQSSGCIGPADLRSASEGGPAETGQLPAPDSTIRSVEPPRKSARPRKRKTGC